MSSKKGKKKAAVSSNWLSIASSLGSKAKLSVKPKGDAKSKASREPADASSKVIVPGDKPKSGLSGIKIAPSVMQVGRFILRGIDTSKPAPRLTTHLALDCEMVGVGPKDRSVLAQICVVNYDCEVIYSTYVQPQEKVADYRTWVSGVKPEHLRRAPTFAQVQREVGILTEGRVIVGHGLSNDLTVLMLKHPRRMIRDTAKFPAYQWLRGGQRRPKRLLQLASEYLNMKIYSGEHDPAEDAIAPMRLYRHAARQWEAWLKTGMRGQPDDVPMAEGVAEKRAGKRDKWKKKHENRWQELEERRKAREEALGAETLKQLARQAEAAPGEGLEPLTGLTVSQDTDTVPPKLAKAPPAASAHLQGRAGGPSSAGSAAASSGTGSAPVAADYTKTYKQSKLGKKRKRKYERTSGAGKPGGARYEVEVDKRLPFRRLQAGRILSQKRREAKKAERHAARGGNAAGGAGSSGGYGRPSKKPRTGGPR